MCSLCNHKLSCSERLLEAVRRGRGLWCVRSWVTVQELRKDRLLDQREIQRLYMTGSAGREIG